MKKYLLVVICTVLLFTVSGCSNSSKVVCSKTTKQDNNEAKEEGTFEFDKDGKLTKASGKYTFNDKEVAKNYCTVFTMAVSDNKDLIKCTDDSVEILDLLKFGDDGEEKDKLKNMTKDELIKFEEDAGYTCE